MSNLLKNGGTTTAAVAAGNGAIGRVANGHKNNNGNCGKSAGNSKRIQFGQAEAIPEKLSISEEVRSGVAHIIKLKKNILSSTFRWSFELKI